MTVPVIDVVWAYDTATAHTDSRRAQNSLIISLSPFETKLTNLNPHVNPAYHILDGVSTFWLDSFDRITASTSADSAKNGGGKKASRKGPNLVVNLEKKLP
jgi:hypothetical protein